MAGETPDQGQGRIINGRYRLLRTLGAGGMGRVWLAYDEELACEVSMKEIALPDVPMDATEPAQRIARAHSEARHAARLRGHPHVATVHDVVVHEGLSWIVMEYVPDATDLQAVIRRSGPLSPQQVARIGLAVLDALTAGHRIGILHRDVKPANILLAADASGDPHARVLLTDYGIALQPESREPRLTATAGILGTPGYLAPERARGEPPTPAADMFSLGATLSPKPVASTPESREPTGPVHPYGKQVGLTEQLEAGDCVRVVWAGAPFKSLPNLGVVDCGEDWPEGQVVAVDTAADYADARAQGTKRCEQQAGPMAEALPDAAVYAVVPTKEGFSAAGGRTACLVLGRHAAIGGEVGRFRDKGSDLYVAQMGIGDCWTYIEEKDTYKSPLVDCAKPHTDQVIGFAEAPESMEYQKAVDDATDLCSNKFESTWGSGEERAVFGWTAGKTDWNDGFTTVVCTVGRIDNEKTTGKISAPGAV